MSVESGVLVIHCSDPRYQSAFHDFLHDDLRLERYGLIAVPGGPQFLAELAYLPKFAWAGWRWVKFMGKLGNKDRIILIAHDDCRWYRDMGLALTVPLREKQIQDMREVSARVRERFGDTKVEIYYAQPGSQGVAFEAL